MTVVWVFLNSFFTGFWIYCVLNILGVYGLLPEIYSQVCTANISGNYILYKKSCTLIIVNKCTYILSLLGFTFMLQCNPVFGRGLGVSMSLTRMKTALIMFNFLLWNRMEYLTDAVQLGTFRKLWMIFAVIMIFIHL